MPVKATCAICNNLTKKRWAIKCGNSSNITLVCAVCFVEMALARAGTDSKMTKKVLMQTKILMHEGATAFPKAE